MSNIGFMENCLIAVETLFDKYIKDSKKYPSKVDMEDYRKLLYHLEIMHKYGEIEDEKKYQEFMERFKNADITKVVELRKKLKNRGGGVIISLLTLKNELWN